MEKDVVSENIAGKLEMNKTIATIICHNYELSLTSSLTWLDSLDLD